MTLFESLLALLLAAILLSQLSRRIAVPYPSMLAAAGVAVALIPGTPTIAIDPRMALALFVAPALLDAAFDFPLAAVRKLWRPLIVLALVAVLLTTACVATLGWAVAGLPVAAALALGAIVAPPDAAAASAILHGASLPRRTVEVLKGESLLNDGTALLIFSGAVAIQGHGGIDLGIAGKLTLAAPGGLLLGHLLARLYRHLMKFVAGTLGGNLLEFVNTFWVWILAERLGLSAVLCVVAFAMTIARLPEVTQKPRNRVHSFAVWSSAVFLLNVLAFLFMGMQARTIVAGMPRTRLAETVQFAGLVVATVIVVRLATVLFYNRLAARFAGLRGDASPATVAQGFVVGWCGMRGLVTMATAFALPADFPQRDLIVIAAFGVVLATLVVQGLTLNPLIAWLGLAGSDEGERELDDARRSLADAGLAALDGEDGRIADHVRHHLELERCAPGDEADAATLAAWHDLQRGTIQAQRRRLADLRDDDSIGADSYAILQEELDWKELTLRPATDATIEES